MKIEALYKTIWLYRGFVFGSVGREFQIKYQNSLLGAAWNVINPLAMIFIYTVIFSQVMEAKLPNVEHSFAYGTYLCAGVLIWGLFSEIVSRGQNVFIDNSSLLKKINFPRLCLPLIMVLAALLNFSIVFLIFVGFLVLNDCFPGLVFVGIFPVIFVAVIFAIGLGISLGVLNVFFRDVGGFFGVFIQFWFWLTPIVYPSSVLPEKYQWIAFINPMSSVVASSQSIFVNGVWPNWISLLPTFALGVIMVFIGLKLFRKHAGEMVDEL